MVHADNDIAGWLVEWPQSKNNHARWWHPEHGWCIDANDAIRFMRKEDAEAYIKSMRFGDGRVATEHVWFNERLWPKPMGHAYRDIDLAAAAKQDSQRGELWTAAHAALTFIQNEYRDDEAAALQGDPFSHEARPVIAELCSALWPEPPVPAKQALQAPPVEASADRMHAPLPSNLEPTTSVGEWRDMADAPKASGSNVAPISVMLCWTNSREDGSYSRHVGEGYWASDDEGGGDWWWANTAPGDYYHDTIQNCISGQIIAWRPLPPPPGASPDPSGREGDV